MSYEGYKEFLCTRGHYRRCGCWEDDLAICTFCDEPIAFQSSVDTTNGQDENEPWTMPASKEEIGFDDDWRQDHYGNNYAVKVLRFEPLERWLATHRMPVAGQGALK